MITEQQLKEMEIRLMGKTPTTTPKPSDPVTDESILHNQIVDYCQSHGWAYLHGAMSTRTHRSEGEPDFSLLASGGRHFLIECKRKTGKLTPAQLAFAAHARRNGHTVYLVRSLDEFLYVVTGMSAHLYAIL